MVSAPTLSHVFFG